MTGEKMADLIKKLVILILVGTCLYLGYKFIIKPFMTTGEKAVGTFYGDTPLPK